MDYAKVQEHRESIGFSTRFRLALWRLAAGRASAPNALDLNGAPDHVLRDLGLPRPNQAWDESVAFWRER